MTPIELQRADSHGLPLYWAETDLPFMCGLVVRAGHVDETLDKSGRLHLLEHLLMDPSWSIDEVNASVDATLMHFWYAAQRDEALSMLAQTLAAAASPPMARLERERSVLYAEAGTRSRHAISLHASLRFGPRGHGLLYYDEYGLNAASRDDLRELANRYFVRENAALYMTGEPPSTFAVKLPAGRRNVAVLPPTIPYLEYPTVYENGPPGVVSLSFLTGRSYPRRAAHTILEHRLREWLRHREGVTYFVDSTYEPQSPDTAHVTLWADCRAHNVEFVRDALVVAVDELAEQGPTDSELDWYRARIVRSLEDPAALASRAFEAAAAELDGHDRETVSDVLRAIEGVTGEAVRAAAEEVFQTMIVAQPSAARRIGGRFSLYPLHSTSVVDGTTYRPAQGDSDAVEDDVELVVGEVGVTHVAGDAVSTVAYDECVALLRWDDDGTLGLWSADGFYVRVTPAHWQDGEDAAARILDSPAAAVLVELDHPPPAFDDDTLNRADAAGDTGDYETAVTLFERGLDSGTVEPEALRKLGYAHWTLGNRHAAIETLRRAADLDPMDAWTHETLARLHADSEDPQEAAGAVFRALQAAPSSLDTLVLAAEILVKAGDAARARRAGERAVELFPEASRAWFALGWPAQAQADWPAAEAALTRASELEPDNAYALNNLAVLLLKLDRPAEAKPLLERALEVDPENMYARENHALARKMLGEGTADADARAVVADKLRRAEEAIEAHRDDAALLTELAWAQIVAGRDLEAIETAGRALALEPSPSRYDVVATAYRSLGRFDEARELLQRALHAFPDDPGLLHEAALFSAVTGDAELGEQAAARIAAVAPVSMRAQLSAGYAAASRGDWAAARQAFGDAVERNPLHCCARAWLGISLAEQGDLERAAEQVLETERRDLVGCENLARLRALLDGS